MYLPERVDVHELMEEDNLDLAVNNDIEEDDFWAGFEFQAGRIPDEDDSSSSSVNSHLSGLVMMTEQREINEDGEVSSCGFSRATRLETYRDVEDLYDDNDMEHIREDFYVTGCCMEYCEVRKMMEMEEVLSSVPLLFGIGG